MSFRNANIIRFLGSEVRRVRRSGNLITIWADCLDNVRSITSHNLIGLHGLLRGQLYFFFYTQSVGLLGRRISPSHCLYLHTRQHKQNKRRYPCLQWDSNQRPQNSRRWKQFMPQTARPLWSALIYYYSDFIKVAEIAGSVLVEHS
jgi:hypothetical protein